MAEGIQSSRPTIAVEGQDRPALSGGLLSLRLEENVEGLYSCEVTFGNWGASNGKPDFLHFDRRLLEFGKELKVKLGTDELFAGKITALEGSFPDAAPPELNVLAEDRLQDLRMTRRTRTFTDVSDRDVVTRIAGDHGLTADSDLSGPTHKVLAQLDQSDLAFLRERARANDAELAVSGTKLSVKSHAGRTATAPTLTHGGSLRRVDVLADLAHQRTSVDVGGWDPSGKRALKENATDSTVSGELKGGDSGAKVLRSSLGERKESVAQTVPLSSQEARARAESIFKHRARRFVVARGVAETNASLRAGVTVKLDRLGPLFNGEYYITSVRHLFDGAEGLRTEFVAERAGLGRP
jgi:phage protein D